MGSVASVLMAVGLAVIPFNFGSHRWVSEWTRTVRGVSVMMLLVFLPWFVVSLGIGASRALVPFVMLGFCVAYGMGLWTAARRPRSRR